MEKKMTRYNLFRIILAVVFICLGIVALGNNLDWWNINDLFLEWWPLTFILLGFIAVFARGGSRGGGVFLILLGVLFLLQTQGIYDFSDLIWPVMLIFLGILILPRKKQISNPDSPDGVHTAGTDHVFNINTLFRGQHEIINDKQFAGGRGTAVFGNLEINLRQAEPKTDAYIELNAVFANVSLAIPSSWDVIRQGKAVLGKVEDKRKSIPEFSCVHSVTIKMNTVLGHIELIN